MLRSRRIMLRSTSIAFVCFFLCALLLEWRGGAFAAEFGGTADEAAHYVTSLMVRDYVASGMTVGPDLVLRLVSLRLVRGYILAPQLLRGVVA